jgi:hypothetical protein
VSKSLVVFVTIESSHGSHSYTNVYNIIEDILLDGDFGVNIIIKKLIAKLKFLKLNLHLTICEW